MSAGVTDTVVEWESTGFPNEKMKPPITANNSFSPKLRYMTRQLLKTRPRNFTSSNAENLSIFNKLEMVKKSQR